MNATGIWIENQDDTVEIIPVPRGETPGHLARIGLITLSSGMTCEEEMHTMLPTGTMVLTTRIRNQDSINLSTLADMEDDLVRSASTLLPEGHLDALVYSCTSGTIAMGEESVFRHLRTVKPGIAVTTPFTGAVTALGRLGCKQITMLTPYTEEVTRAMRHELQRRGLHVIRTVAFGLSLDSEMSSVDPQTVRNMAEAIDSPDAEALFISCTALRTSPIIEELEESLGKPVVTSNQGLVWHALRLSGYDKPVSGYGQLLHLPLSPAA